MTDVPRREGTRHIYTLQPGEDWRALPDGRIVIVHPEREPKIVDVDGVVTELKPGIMRD